MKNLTTEEFIKKARLIHGDKYNYTMTNYVNGKNVVNILCDMHGLFQQTPSNHLVGQNCPICMNKGKSNVDRFINSAKQVHGDRYDYSTIKYFNNRIKIDIICKKHGAFKQTPTRHLCGDGCPKCNGGVKISQEEFIFRAKMLYGEKYDYSQVNYVNSSTKVNIICVKHGIFLMRPNNHLSGQECSLCKNKSFGEKQIYKWLVNNSIKFETQKVFSDCINKNKLPFDFYLPEFNTLIEYDGKQHHKPINYIGGEKGFKYRKENDSIKTDFAEKNNVKLLRISYLERKNLSTILDYNFINI